MAAKARVEVEGADRLERTLRAAADNLVDMPEVHARAGVVLASTAKELVPRRSGRLAGTITAVPGRSGVVVTAGSAEVPYAGVQEFGWSARRIPAHPYLTESLARHEAGLVDAHEDAVDKVLAQVKGA